MNYLQYFLENQTSLPIIFCAGLDNRSTDLNLETQIEYLRLFNPTRHITTFCSSSKCSKHDDRKRGVAKEFIRKNPNSIILLFSAGAYLSDDASELIRNKQNLFILEPYAESQPKVKKAILNGVPVKNIIVGKSPGTGQGILGSLGTPSKTPVGYSHFGSLKYVSKIISEL